MKNKVFIILIIAFACVFPGGKAYAQYATNVIVTDYQDEATAKKIEKNASQLLTSFNTAFVSDKTPSLNLGGISKTDKEFILTMWEMSPFKCIETEIIERLYKTRNGYQVRNIPMFLKGVPEADAERNIVINFDKTGNLCDIYFALEEQDYMAIIRSESNEVSDLRRRQIVLDFVENYRTAYNRKDIGFIGKVFSNDALIITGRVIESKPSEMNRYLSATQVEYQVSTKAEYIEGLKRVFKNNQRVDIKFDEISVVQHPKYDHIYGVTLKQDWYTTNYSDVGYVFLFIDFKDENNPLIKVRTWQPSKYKGKDIDPGKIFDLGDFDII